MPGKENPKLKTGAIEVRATDLAVYNATPTPPFEMHGAEPNDVADAVHYLLCAEAVTGQMLAVDGGQHLIWQTPDVQVSE